MDGKRFRGMSDNVVSNLADSGDPDAQKECKRRGGQTVVSEWLPMETAPRDGTEVILAVEMRAGVPGRFLVGHYMPGGFCVQDHPAIDEGWYFWTGIMFDTASRPLFWMPLPETPGAAGRTDGPDKPAGWGNRPWP